MPDPGLNAADRAWLGRLGFTENEIERQVARIRRPPTWVSVVRPCAVGDGIRVLSGPEIDRRLALHADAAADGRFTKFVPASGAATRMFRDLLAFPRSPGERVRRGDVAARARQGDPAAAAVERLLSRLGDFPFHDRLRRIQRGRGAAADDVAPVLGALLDADGLALAGRPKGLIDFHVYPDGARSAFEEHLVEAADYTRDAEGGCRLHFTVSPEHREDFESLCRDVLPVYQQRLGVRYDVGFSDQKPSSGTVAADLEGNVFRDASGQVLVRPGGHGALIENLQDLSADLVYVKNIDNVQPDRLKPLVGRWKRILGGHLVQLERRRNEILAELEPAPSPEEILSEAHTFATTRLHIGLDGRFATEPARARRAWLIDRLRRPLRVCGVVRNTGEPGGGPFWVRERDGSTTLQIVERAQIDPEDATQQDLFSRATHFNPVDLVCSLRDPEGGSYDLSRFVDPDTAIVTRKSHAGRELLALERPGLWNGAMAGWNTVFVEVPLETFSPVKSVFDLLRDEHRTETPTAAPPGPAPDR